MKKYQVFISSTYNDLIEERLAVRDAVLMLSQFPVGMEQFTASDDDQWKVIQRSIDCSDYYILILGKRYGSLIEKGEYAGISYTQREFEYALSKGIPIHAFIKDDKASFSGDSFETDPDKLQKLIRFTEKVIKGRTVQWFKNPNELATQVSASLYQAVQKNDRPGWIRGDQTNIETKVEELIDLLKDEYGFGESEASDDFDIEVNDYEFKDYQIPTDGKHRKVNSEGTPISEGEWKDGKLINGIEYDYLILVTKGKLIYKPDCPEDPYDSSEDFEYEKYDQYGWHLHLFPFQYSKSMIVDNGLDGFYVADLIVDEKTEQMVNIRTLEEFLSEKDPKFLGRLRNLIND